MTLLRVTSVNGMRSSKAATAWQASWCAKISSTVTVTSNDHSEGRAPLLRASLSTVGLGCTLLPPLVAWDELYDVRRLKLTVPCPRNAFVNGLLCCREREPLWRGAKHTEGALK